MASAVNPRSIDNVAEASVAGSGFTGGPITFSAVGCTRPGTGYTISVCYVTPMSASQRAAFDAAVFCS